MGSPPTAGMDRDVCACVCICLNAPVRALVPCARVCVLVPVWVCAYVCTDTCVCLCMCIGICRSQALALTSAVKLSYSQHFPWSGSEKPLVGGGSGHRSSCGGNLQTTPPTLQLPVWAGKLPLPARGGERK